MTNIGLKFMNLRDYEDGLIARACTLAVQKNHLHEIIINVGMDKELHEYAEKYMEDLIEHEVVHIAVAKLEGWHVSAMMDEIPEKPFCGHLDRETGQPSVKEIKNSEFVWGSK